MNGVIKVLGVARSTSDTTRDLSRTPTDFSLRIFIRPAP